MDERKDKDLIPKLVCLILAFLLWFYVSNVENPTRTSTIKNISLNVLNEDKLEIDGLALKPNQNFTVDIKIEGPANVVYSLSPSDFSLAVDFQEYALKIGENNIPVKVLTYPEQVKIKNKDVLSIKVEIEELVEKDIDVKNKVNYTFANGYSLNNLTLEPSKVRVSGAKTAIEHIDSVVLVGEVNNISKNYIGSFDLMAVNGNGIILSNVKLSDTKGEIHINVNKSKEVGIKANYDGNLISGLSIISETLSEDTVTITGDPNIIDNIDTLQLQPLNLSTLAEGGDFNCRIILPEGITCNHESITIHLELKDERIIRKVLKNIKINYESEKDRFTYNGPETMDIEIEGIKENINKVKESDINIVADLSAISETGDEQSVPWNATIAESYNVAIVKNSGTIKVNVKGK